MYSRMGVGSYVYVYCPKRHYFQKHHFSRDVKQDENINKEMRFKINVGLSWVFFPGGNLNINLYVSE